MSFIGDLRDGVDRLAQFAELDCEATTLAAGASALSDASVREAFTAVADLSRHVQKLEVALVGVIARRSTRAAGHAGLAQTGGFRTPVQMVQEITGIPRSEAIRVVKVGETLAEGADAEGSRVVDDALPGGDARRPWHEPLGAALLAGSITHAQLDAIRRGLGEPPPIEGRAEDDVVEVWRVAAAQLIDEAPRCTVEDLSASARAVRDAIDPAGAEARWAEHYQARSFRMRIDADGRTHGHIVFDDVTAAFWQSVMDAALRPRRGGPRFVSADEAAQARQLSEDPRTNEQLAFDLFADLVRAGATAEAKDVFGTKQAGVRFVTIRGAGGTGGGGAGGLGARDAFGRLLAVAHTEDGRVSVPGSVIDRMVCETGVVPVTVDSCGNPLDVGRESRLFTPAQRTALAVRDGGCMWPGCDRPPLYCEAHHIDEWCADGGRTDIDRGILLCAYHHVHLHLTGWKIVREGQGAFLLVPPPGEGSPPIELRSKAPLRWMFDPPPRTGWRTAA
ncbi:DUF222 domain-containing protein [Microbacterium aurum]|uniref:HNH endonuclease signature motif containing protein n=1 Tax=Microbacterium aurum TaxID=36805 RepID=UPI0028E3C2B4|nr:DUF222 domain-containing protein [Microbacterium aurum]